MTTDPALDALDERGRAAGAAVRVAVADRPAPELDADLVRVDLDDVGGRAGPRRRIGVLVGVAAAVALLLGAAVVLAGRGEPESTPADRIGADELARYVPGDVPEGYEPSAVVEPGPGDGLEGQVVAEFAVYGTEVTEPVVAVGVIPQEPGGPPVVLDGLDPVDAGARRAWDASAFLGAGAVVAEVGDDLVYVLGASAGAEEVVRVAGSVAVEGGVARLPEGDLPDGWRLLDDALPAQSLLGGSPLTGSTSFGSPTQKGGVLYVRGEGHGGVPVAAGTTHVWSWLGGELDVHLPVLASDEVETVTVRGRPGVLAHASVAEGWGAEWVLRWEERPGEVVEVAVSDAVLDADDVLALAEGLRPASEEDLEELRRAALHQDLDQPGTTLVGEGTASDGSLWILVAASVGGQPYPDLRTTAVHGGDDDHATAFADAESGPDGTLFADTASRRSGGGLQWAYGLLDDGVAAVEARDAGTGAVIGQAEVLGDDVRGWVLELDGRAGSVLVVALDADGAELASIDLSL